MSNPIARDAFTQEADGTVRVAQYVAEVNLPVGADPANDLQKGEQRYSLWHNDAGVGSTSIKSVPGFLHLVTINNLGASGQKVTLWDSLADSGKILAVIVPTAPCTLIYNGAIAIGLRIKIEGGTSPDVTVSYR